MILPHARPCRCRRREWHSDDSSIGSAVTPYGLMKHSGDLLEATTSPSDGALGGCQGGAVTRRGARLTATLTLWEAERRNKESLGSRRRCGQCTSRPQSCPNASLSGKESLQWLLLDGQSVTVI